MIGNPRHKEKLLIVVIGIILPHTGALAGGELDARYILTYQDSKTAGFDASSFAQHYEAKLRDRLFETHVLSVSLFFDNTRNLTFDQTVRRYRGEINVTHRNYSLNARMSPRQKITALEIEPSRETTNTEVSFDLHVRDKPRLRLFHSRRSRYEAGEFTSRTRDFRGDVSYTYKVLFLSLNRWFETTDNGGERTTTVTGGTVRLTKAVGDWLNVRSGYDAQLTETAVAIGPDQTVLNQTFSTSLSAQHKRIVTGSLSIITRHSTTEFQSKSRGRDDVISSRITFFPRSPVYVEVLRNYTRSKRPERNSLSDYATLQIITTIPARKRFSGRAQVARRYEIKRLNTGIPANLYFISLGTQVYEGIDLRADLNVAERQKGDDSQSRYQTSSLVDLFMRPRDNLQVAPFIRYVNFSEHFTLLRNERVSYGTTVNYRPRPRLSVGSELRRNKETTGTLREDTSVSFNVAASLRDRATFNATYGINEVDEVSAPPDQELNPNRRANTFNVQAQVWLTRRGALSVNYSEVDRDEGGDTQFVGVTYRQDF